MTYTPTRVYNRSQQFFIQHVDVILNAAILHELEGAKNQLDGTSVTLSSDPVYKEDFGKAKTAITFRSRKAQVKRGRAARPKFEDSMREWIEACSAQFDEAYRAKWLVATNQVVEFILPRRFPVSNTYLCLHAPASSLDSYNYYCDRSKALITCLPAHNVLEFA